MQGGWGRGYVRTDPSDGGGELEDEEVDDERGRTLERDGSAEIRGGPPSPPKDKDGDGDGHEDEEVKMVVDLSPVSPSPSLSSTDSGDESDTSLETASSGFGFMEEGEALMKIDLEGVAEEDEGEMDVKYVFLVAVWYELMIRKAMLESEVIVDNSETSGMDVDVVLGSKIPTIQIITPNNE